MWRLENMETINKRKIASHAGLTGSSHTGLTGSFKLAAFYALTSHAGLTALLKNQSRWLDTINTITSVYYETNGKQNELKLKKVRKND